MNTFKIQAINKIIKIAPIFLFFFILAIGLSPEESPTALEIIRTVEQKTRGESSRGRYEITIDRSRYQRKLVIDSWDDTVGDRAFIRILEPKKDAGTTFLKIKQSMWQYIPSIGKEIKIEGSLLQDSWMGSDLSNDDLVRSTSMIDDFNHKRLPTDHPDEYRIELKPKPAAPIIWSRIVYDVRTKDYLPTREEFYDHKDRLVRVILFEDYQTMDGRLIPTKLTVQTIKNERVQSRTIMRYLKISFNEKIPDYVFSRANLRR